MVTIFTSLLSVSISLYNWHQLQHCSHHIHCEISSRRPVIALFIFAILYFLLIFLPHVMLLVGLLIGLLQALVTLTLIKLSLQKCRAYLLHLCGKEVAARPSEVTLSLTPFLSVLDRHDNTQLEDQSSSGSAPPDTPVIPSDTTSDIASDTTSDTTSNPARPIPTTELSTANAEYKRSTSPMCTVPRRSCRWTSPLLRLPPLALIRSVTFARGVSKPTLKLFLQTGMYQP